MKRLTIFWTIFAALTCWAYQSEGTIQGRTLDLAGEPLPEVTLTFSNEEDPDSQKTITSKSNGDYMLQRVKTGPMAIAASKKGYISRTFKYTQKQERMTIDLRLVAEGVTIESLGPQPMVKGRVIDSSDKPLEGVEVTLTTELFPDLKRTAVTDGNGRFQVEGLAHADLQVYLHKDGYRDRIDQFIQRNTEFNLTDMDLQTLEEAAAELGLEVPKGKRTPEDLAVEYYNAAVDPYRAKNYEEAEVMAKKALEQNPKLEAALKMLVYINRHTNDWDEVVTFSEKYLDLKPKDQGIAQIAMEATEKTEKSERTEAFKGKLKQMNAGSPDAVFNQAVNALNVNDDETARAHLEEVIRLDETYAQAYYELGKIFIREGDFEAAVLNLKYFLKHAPKDDRLRGEVTDLIVTLSE